MPLAAGREGGARGALLLLLLLFVPGPALPSCPGGKAGRWPGTRTQRHHPGQVCVLVTGWGGGGAFLLQTQGVRRAVLSPLQHFLGATPPPTKTSYIHLAPNHVTPFIRYAAF